MPVADPDTAMSQSATRPGHPVGRLVLPQAATPAVDERLESEQRAELELVPYALPGVARLASRDEVLDPVRSAANQRDHVVQRQWPCGTAVGADSLQQLLGSSEVVRLPAARIEPVLPRSLVDVLAMSIRARPLPRGFERLCSVSLVPPPCSRRHMTTMSCIPGPDVDTRLIRVVALPPEVPTTLRAVQAIRARVDGKVPAAERARPTPAYSAWHPV